MAESTLTGVSQTLAELGTLRSAMNGPALRAIVEEQTWYMRADAISRVSFGTGRYREAIRQKVFDNSPDGFAGSVFVAPRTPRLLPIWLEYGTRKMDPRPHLKPAFNAAKERFNRAVERLLQQSSST